ncbi:site-specific integrase [Vibrio sp. 624788]|uniref:site-specific integrase n=1 Tax=Vibrio sp. 624788 TaxID=1234362 RepID=UPI0003141372|nr:site-specific integrase [Vibrio sp. 624788]
MTFKFRSTRDGFYDTGDKGFLISFPNNRIYWDATDYLTDRAGFSHQDTVYNHALYLTKFFNWLTKGFTSNNQSSFYTNVINGADQDKIKSYKSHLLKTLKASSVNQNLSVIIEYYWWLQKNKKTNEPYLCGWADNEKGIPKHRIQVKAPKSQGAEYSNPLLIKGAAQKNIGYVPSRSEMTALAKLVALKAMETAPKREGVDLSEEYKVRNLLVFDWMSQAGLRRNEMRLLKCEAIHQAAKRAQNEEDGIKSELAKHQGKEYERSKIRKLIKVEIKTGLKKNKERIVHITPELLERTLDYIDFEREDILETGKCKDTGELIVTVHTKPEGSSCAVSKPYINNMLKVKAKLDGEEVLAESYDVVPHALRRYALKQYATILWQVELKRVEQGQKKEVDEIGVLNALRGFAGHNDPDTTLKHYVNITKAIAEAGDSALENTRSEIEQMRILIAELESSLD